MLDNPEVSVLVMVSRPGGLDILFEGLKHQTVKDFELILVDNRYEKRKEQVADWADHYGINIVHAPEHRRDGKWITAIAGFNTAFALARGRVCIILHDYTYVPPNWIESHLNAVGSHTRCLVLGDHQNVDLPELQKPLVPNYETNRAVLEVDDAFEGQDEMAIFKQGIFSPSWLPLPVGPNQWQPIYRGMYNNGVTPDWTWVTLTNDSIPREFVYELNGIDERYDHGRTSWDHEIGIRIANSGGARIFMPDPIVTILNPRFVMRSKPFGDLNNPMDGRWTFADGTNSNIALRASGATRARNPYDIRVLSKQLEPWRQPGVAKVPIDVPQIAYWKQIIRPETPC